MDAHLYVCSCGQAENMHLLHLLLAATRASASWLSQVKCDLVMLSRFEPFFDFKDHTLLAWHRHAAVSGPSFRRNARQALSSASARHPDAWYEFQCTEADNGDHVCLECHAVFSSARALTNHRYAKHGFKRILRTHVISSSCSVCLGEFHSRDRLLFHLARATCRCAAVLLDRGSLISPEEAEELDGNERAANRKLFARGCQPTKAFLPHIRAEGPYARDAFHIWR